MAFTESRIFRQYIADIVGNTTAVDFDSDALKAALYNNTGTPSRDVTAANSAYNTDQWVTANEQSSSGQWAAGGVALASKTITTPTSGVVMADAADTSSGATATLANVYGCLVYDTTVTTPVANQGICYNYFGGANSVTSGTFTVVWSANGLFRITV
jgi:hypothetical protein